MDGNTVRRFRTTNLRDYLARFDSLSRAPLSFFFVCFCFLYCPDLICSALCHVVINNDDKNRPSGSSPSRTLVVQKGQLESFICVRVTNLSASYSPISFCILYFYLLFHDHDPFHHQLATHLFVYLFVFVRLMLLLLPCPAEKFLKKLLPFFLTFLTFFPFLLHPSRNFVP